MKVQLTLANTLLLVTAVALSVALWLHRDQIQWYQHRLSGLRDAARELVVGDRELVHGVQRHPEWYGEKKWDVYIPEGDRFRLLLATEEIPLNASPNQTFPVAEKSFVLEPGRHTVELQRRRTDINVVEVFVDGQSVFLVEKSKQWHPDNTGTSSGSDLSVCKSFAKDRNVKLIGLRISVKGPGNRMSPGSNGVMLWISSDAIEGDQ